MPNQVHPQKIANKLPKNSLYSPKVHKTIEDICLVCLQELDLHAEGQYKHKKKNLLQYLRIIKIHSGDRFLISEAMTSYRECLRQTDWLTEDNSED